MAAVLAAQGGAMMGAGNVERPAPLFFLSYAHSRGGTKRFPPREPNEKIITFFNDLSQDVADLVASPAGADPGFLDRSVPYGAPWAEVVLQALGTCQVFVALVSGPYVSSTWCSHEWYAFSQRKVAGLDQPGDQTAIIPVIWAPLPEEHVPEAIRKVQRFRPDGLPNLDISEQYERHGVLGLMRTDQGSSYHGVVWQLAQCIAGFHYSHYSVERRVLHLDELRDIFKETGRERTR